MRIHKSVLIGLVVISILAAILRFWHLGVNPIGFHRDEAFLGYNAYSILKTGKDMSGNAFPMHLQSFFYSPAGYSYTSIPFIWAFGLNEFSSRFASALFGTLSVIATFFFVSLLFSLEIQRTKGAKEIAQDVTTRDTVALLSSFVLAISPWHINASRIGIEITLVVFLLISATISFLQYLKSKHMLLFIGSFICFALTFTVYQSPRAFVPILIPVLFFVYRTMLPKKHLIFAGVLYLTLIVLPLFAIIKSPILSLRIASLSVFNAPHAQLKIDEAIREDGITQSSAFLARVFHNKVIGYSNEILDNYMSHFSFDFLFRDKAYPSRMTIFGAGNMHIIELLFLLAGIYILTTRRSRYHTLIGIWILLAPLGSSLTYDDVPNMQRTLLMQPALSILVALGIYALLKAVRSKKYFIVPVLIGIGLYFFNVVQYQHAYYTHQPYQGSQFRNTGYKELVQEVAKNAPAFKHIVVTNAESAPSVFFLFFSSYDPALYQKESHSADKNKSDSINFASYIFEDADCPLNVRLGIKKDIPYVPRILSQEDKESLFVHYRGCPVATESALLLHTIARPNGQEIFQILKAK